MKSEYTATFERDLEDLLLTAFSCGAEVEGEWEFTVPITDAPDWTVTIEKQTTEEETTHDPDFLEK